MNRKNIIFAANNRIGECDACDIYHIDKIKNYRKADILDIGYTEEEYAEAEKELLVNG